MFVYTCAAFIIRLQCQLHEGFLFIIFTVQTKLALKTSITEISVMEVCILSMVYIFCMVYVFSFKLCSTEVFTCIVVVYSVYGTSLEY